MQPNGRDYVVIYRNLSDPASAIRYTGTAATYRWTDYAYNTLLEGMDTFYPEDGKGYLLITPTDTTAVYVLDYSQYLPTCTTLTFSPDCEKTTLYVDGTIPPMSYQTPAGRTISLGRKAVVSYTTLAWQGESYADSLALDTVVLATEMLTGAPYANTTFTLRYDQYAEQMGLEPDSLVSEEMEAIAVVMHPTSITAVRGQSVENEAERPIAETQLSGSAPLDVQFKSNANKPVAQFFRWEIYEGSSLLAQRSDEDQRYRFDEAGQYQVKVWASNHHCTTDSVVFTVTVSNSDLRVPNVFTPDGDGQNDEFRVMYRSIVEFECWVYNRWGKLVYHWTDPAKGWDGTIHGHPAAAGAYYYIIRARGADAAPGARFHKTTKRNPAEVGVYQLSGTVNLLRRNY